MQENKPQESAPVRRVSNDLERYEYEKLIWIAYHPKATPREYEKAMVEIAWRCGV